MKFLKITCVLGIFWTSLSSTADCIRFFQLNGHKTLSRRALAQEKAYYDLVWKISEDLVKIHRKDPEVYAEDVRRMPLVPSDLQILPNGGILIEKYLDRLSAIITPLGSFPVIGVLRQRHFHEYQKYLSGLGYELTEIETKLTDLSIPMNARMKTFYAVSKLPNGKPLPFPAFRRERDYVPEDMALKEWQRLMGSRVKGF